MPQLMLDYYKAIEDSSERMVDAAMAQDWEGMVRFEGVCAVLIEQLRSMAREQELPREHRHEKAQIMQRILRNDAQIRDISESWLSQGGMDVVGTRQFLH